MDKYIDNELLVLCRTCLSKSEKLLPLTAIIDEENLNVKDYLKKYVQFECIDYDDHPMPENICLKCFDRLLEVRNYNIQCQESEKFLKLKFSLSSPSNIQTVDIKFEILDDQNKNHIDFFENFEMLEDENDDNLEFVSNDVDVAIDFDEKIESICQKYEDVEEPEYLTDKLGNVDVLSRDFDMMFDNSNSNIESWEEKCKNLNKTSEELVEKNYKNTFMKCVCCNKIFNTPIKFQEHLCITQQLNELNNDITDNSQNKINHLSCRHTCEYCDASFVILAFLHRHMTTNHNNLILYDSQNIELNNLDLGCSKCEKQHKSKKILNKNNYIKKYKKKKQQFVCTICGKVYHNSISMKEHEFAHQGIKPYKCEYCGREFGHECVRRAHLKLHTGKDIKCTLCDKKFVAQSQLRIHMTYHTNDLKFPCDICPKRFRRNHQLQLHRKIHTGRKTEQCEYCDSCFYTKDDLRGHLNSVHLKSYHCHLCKNRYSEPGRLRNHFHKFHNVEIEDVSCYKKNKNELKILMRTRKEKIL